MKFFRRLASARRGSALLEFALIGPMTIVGIMGIIGSGVLVWAIGSLHTVAASTARCGALGTLGVPPCTTPALTQSQAVTLAGNWIYAGVITTSNVTTTPDVATCLGTAGRFYRVAISTGAFAWLPAPMNGITLNVSACFPRS